MNRVAERMNDNTIWFRRIDIGKVLSHGFAGAGEHVTVQQTSIEKMLQDNRDSTNAVNIRHVVLAAGLRVGNVWHFVGDAIEIFEI